MRLRERDNRDPGRRAYILVEVLVIVACLLAFLSMLVADQRAGLEALQNRLRIHRAETAAEAGVAYALAALQNADPNLVTKADDWATQSERGLQLVQLKDSTFRYEIVDAGAMVDINTAAEEQLQLLPLDTEQIDCLLDWREASAEPRADGAKDQYYNSLEQPYNTRLGRLETLTELLLVKNWTARLLYEPDTQTVSTAPQPLDTAGNVLPLAGILTVNSGSPNTRADGQARINLNRGGLNPAGLTALGVNQQTATTIAAGAPYTSFRTLLNQAGLAQNAQQALLEAATFSAGTRVEGKININTASESTLMTIPSMTQDIASAIVSRQSSGFQSLGELATVPGLTGNLLAQVADLCTVGSDTWIVRVYGASGGVGVAIEATVQRVNDQMQVVNWERLNVAGIPRWWDWEQETSSVLDMGLGG